MVSSEIGASSFQPRSVPLIANVASSHSTYCINSMSSSESSDSEEDIFIQIVLKKLNEVQKGKNRKKQRHGGSKPGKNPNIDRDRVAGHERIMRDYFGWNGADPVYSERLFRRRYRMRRTLFLRVVEGVCKDGYFKQKLDACGVPGMNMFSLITICWHVLFTMF